MNLKSFRKIKITKNAYIIVFIIFLISTINFVTYANFKREKKYDLLSGQVNGEFTISYNTNGGSECESKIINYNDLYGELCNPTYYGYNLEHWEDEDGNTITSSTKFHHYSDITLNAVYSNVCTLTPGETWTYSYTGNAQDFISPCEGTYKVELWGAQGGTNVTPSNGGKGAYTKGDIALTTEDKLYLYVGQNISFSITKSFNNGTGDNGGYNGGGATDVRLVNGEWDNLDSIKSRIMVAAGGGIALGDGIAGAAGGLYGYNSEGSFGGTQTQAGKRNNISYALSYLGIANGGCTGGNGYYPGGGATCIYGSGGGSSYISGHYNVDSISLLYTNTNPLHTGLNNHYTNRVFYNTKMIDGVGHEWTYLYGDVVNMPTHDGTSTMTGNTGAGYAKITYVSPLVYNNIKAEIAFDDNQNESLKLVSSASSNKYTLSYQWYLNDSPITGATNNSYIVTALGTYKLITSNEYGNSEISNTITISSLSTDYKHGRNAINVLGTESGSMTCIGKTTAYKNIRQYPYQATTCNFNTLNNLFANGSLEYMSTYNAPYYHYDQVNNEMTLTNSYYDSFLGDFAMIDNNKNYIQSISLSSNNGPQVVGIAEFDCRFQPITASTISYINGSTTTLAQDLNPGDTIVYLTNAGGFQVNSSTPSYQLGLIFWNQVDCDGTIFPPHSYSQNVLRTAYSYNGVNKANNTVSLNSAYTGEKIPRGTSVSQSSDGSTYNYGIGYLSNNAILSTMQTYSAIYTKYGNNAKNGTNYVEFRPGATYVKTFIYYAGAEATLTIKNFSFKEYT